MIQGAKICLVQVCFTCQGLGVVHKSTASDVFNGSDYDSRNLPRAPCFKCVNGFVFQGIDVQTLMNELIGLLKGDTALRREFYDLFTRATEEKILEGPEAAK